MPDTPSLNISPAALAAMAGPGWIASGSLYRTSGIVTVPAGTGIDPAVTLTPFRAVSIGIPPAGRALLQAFSVQVIGGAPASQLLVSVIAGTVYDQWNQTNAESLAQLGLIPVNEELDPTQSPIAIDLYNISATSYQGASAMPYDINCLVTVLGVWLSEVNKAVKQWG